VLAVPANRAAPAHDESALWCTAVIADLQDLRDRIDQALANDELAGALRDTDLRRGA
jgi:hypothetical protein